MGFDGAKLACKAVGRKIGWFYSAIVALIVTLGIETGSEVTSPNIAKPIVHIEARQPSEEFGV